MDQYNKVTRINSNNMVPMEIGPVQMYAGLCKVSKTAANALNKIIKILARPEMLKNYPPEMTIQLLGMLGEHHRQPAVIFNDFVRAASKSPEHQETLRQLMKICPAETSNAMATDLTQQEYQEVRARLLQKLREPEQKKEENETKVISGN